MTLPPDKKPTDKRPITLDDINEIDYVDQYKKIEVVDGDWNEADEPFYRGHGMLSGSIQAMFIYLLGTFVEQNKGIGRAYAGSVGFVMEGSRDNIQLMRRTDVSFMKAEHLHGIARDEPFYRAPDLAIEVVNQDFADDMFQRVEDFLSHGTAQVWVVAPSPKTITVFLPDDTARIYRPGQAISGGDLLPGFTLDVMAVFEI